MPDNALWKLIPEFFKEGLRDWVRRTARMSSSQLLTTLYEPLQLTHEYQTIFFDAK